MAVALDHVHQHRQKHGKAEDGHKKADHISDRSQVQHEAERWPLFRPVSSTQTTTPMPDGSGQTPHTPYGIHFRPKIPQGNAPPRNAMIAAAEWHTKLT
ncbi:hypothetical protein NBRC116590_14790 [Pelagimonas sp. KU-00592-HH]